MSFTVTRNEINLSKGISLAKQYHDFVPYKLGDEISFELTSQDRISAKAVCRKDGGMLFCTNHPLSVSGSVCHAMNDDVTNTDGYIFSDLRKYLNSTVIDLFPKDIRDELIPFACGDYLRIPTYNEIFGKYQAGFPSKRWNCMMHQENRILKSEGNSLLDIIPVPYWLATSCNTNFLGAFYYVDRYGDAEKCLAGLSYCTIRLVFELKRH